MRHAHAEWPGYSGEDFDRPLTPQGLADAAVSAREMREARDDPYDTHPPLSRRIEALSKAESARPVVDDRPAIALLNDPASLEAPLIETITGWRVAATRPPIAWSEVGRDVYLPAWRKSGGEVALKGRGNMLTYLVRRRPA